MVLEASECDKSEIVRLVAHGMCCFGHHQHRRTHGPDRGRGSDCSRSHEEAKELPLKSRGIIAGMRDVPAAVARSIMIEKSTILSCRCQVDTFGPLTRDRLNPNGKR